MSNEQLVATLLGIIIALLGFIARKLYLTLDKLEESDKLSHDRHDVTDVVVSHLIQDSYNSKSIAEGGKWPNIFKGPQREQ